MKKICEGRRHGAGCLEWTGIGLFGALLLFVPGLLNMIMAVVTTPLGGSVISLFVLGVAGRKLLVNAWERDRPFNDGMDSTPDLYLFNSGDGNGWALRAFMPDVKTYYFLTTPISWAVKQATRKVAIVLPDGSVTFPWFPVAWISQRSSGGNRVPVPAGYELPTDIFDMFQDKRDKIKAAAEIKKICIYDRDFMAFTNQIFVSNSVFNVNKKPGKIEVLVPMVTVVDLDAVKKRLEKQEEKAEFIFADIMQEFNKVFRQIKEILDLEKRFDKYEQSRPVELGRVKKRLEAAESQLLAMSQKGIVGHVSKDLQGAVKVPPKKRRRKG